MKTYPTNSKTLAQTLISKPDPTHKALTHGLSPMTQTPENIAWSKKRFRGHALQQLDLMIVCVAVYSCWFLA